MTHVSPTESRMPQPSSAQVRNGMGRAGLILGACGIPLFWVPMVYPNAPILGIIFSAIGYSRARAGKATNGKTAIIGLVLGILSLVLPAIVLIGMAFLVMHPDAQ